jgi:hypothetical protein
MSETDFNLRYPFLASTFFDSGSEDASDFDYEELMEV